MLALCFTLLAAVVPQTDDVPVTAAAIKAWSDVPAVDAQAFPTDALGVASFSSRLVESELPTELVPEVVRNFVDRNPAKGALTEGKAYVSFPGYDETRTHALIVASPDGRRIRIALLEKLKDVWYVTYRGEINASKPATSTPRPPLPPDLQPLRVGGDVKPPVVTVRVEPVPTSAAKKARISGIVILEVVIDKNGRVRDVQVLKPLPFGLAEAAVDAVKQWQFRPGTLNDEPVDVLFNLTVQFKARQPQSD